MAGPAAPPPSKAAGGRAGGSGGRIGASRCLLVSDTGQRHNPLPSEALRIFAQTVFEKGVRMDQVMRMISDSPMQLLDVDADHEPSAADLAWARGLVEDPCAVPSSPVSSPVPSAGDPG